ncbi:helix-turn-helix domain-containing protein [Blautia wexlerae]|uniref:helix-turn-helix domain-containing protein n=1 Tax=Blautia wexlerae TaxID=418240 RepID=UPI001C030DD5|nr:helix-turn-helix domain-containing protein [Blautia wexlerae]
MDFGNKLKELRTQNGLTQKQLADQLGVTKSVVSFYERQERTPSPDILRKLAAVFHVSSDFLLGIDTVKRLDISNLDDDDIQLVSLLVDRLRKKNSKK